MTVFTPGWYRSQWNIENSWQLPILDVTHPGVEARLRRKHTPGSNEIDVKSETPVLFCLIDSDGRFFYKGSVVDRRTAKILVISNGPGEFWLISLPVKDSVSFSTQEVTESQIDWLNGIWLIPSGLELEYCCLRLLTTRTELYWSMSLSGFVSSSNHRESDDRKFQRFQ